MMVTSWEAWGAILASITVGVPLGYNIGKDIEAAEQDILDNKISLKAQLKTLKQNDQTTKQFACSWNICLFSSNGVCNSKACN